MPVDQVHEARSLLTSVGPEGTAAPAAAGPEDAPEAEWRGTFRARWAGRVIVALVVALPILWALVDLLRGS